MTTFHFIVPDNAASSKMRGHQVARALGATVSERTWSEKGDTDVAVFVKRTPSEDQIKSARKHSMFVVYDPLDNYDFDSMRGLDFDAVIACSSNHRRKLYQILPCTIASIIPHHHCRSHLRSPPDVADTSRVGYVGDLANLGIPSERIYEAFPDAIISNDLRDLEKIGIGIAYRPHGIARSYKSGVKLANYWAHGIAAVCSPDSSYLEMMSRVFDISLVADIDVFGEWPPLGWAAWIAYDQNEALEMLKEISKNTMLRMDLASEGAGRARVFNLSILSFCYERLASMLKCTRKSNLY